MSSSGMVLGNQATLAKIDKLRALNVGAIIPQPQANLEMGIRMSRAEDDEIGPGAFSQDILKIEINGPEQDHLTVIDVPGIFAIPTPGLTVKSDVLLVENMAKSYMSNKRTIILAVMPCTADITTQGILDLAEQADPSGSRTMGVLTKPDIDKTPAAIKATVDFILEKRRILKLGYYVVKNRGADEDDLTIADCAAAEKAFFADPAWSPISDRCSITELSARLRVLLMEISEQELPPVRLEIRQQLRRSKAALETLGPSRPDQNLQRLYLTKLVSRFHSITQAALDGHYGSDKIFKRQPRLKLITGILKLNDEFADIIWKKGHKRKFGATWNDEGESAFGCSTDTTLFDIRVCQYLEPHGIVETDYQCPNPSEEPIIDRIMEVHESCRGPDLGTFGGTTLATVFEEQTEKWEPLVFQHASKAIILVHNFVFQLLSELCSSELRVRDRVWESLLVPKLNEAYRRALDHARFLLDIERGGRPITVNHYFNANLQKRRSERLSKDFEGLAISIHGYKERHIPVSAIFSHSVDMDNGQQVCEDILDTLMSYYKVSRKRFVDAICQQVISYFLLEGDGNPLQILSPDLILNLSPEQLEGIAGEDDESKHQRLLLERKVMSLGAALEVLQT